MKATVDGATNTTAAYFRTDDAKRELHELVYVVTSLLVGTLSALVASFLGVRRLRQRCHFVIRLPP